MTLNDYQKGCRETAIYPQQTKIDGLTYTLMGLGGEVGELQNKFKKVLRGDHELTSEIIEAMSDELGDIMWYVGEVATQLGMNLADVGAKNLRKLMQRKINDKIKGSGDKR